MSIELAFLLVGGIIFLGIVGSLTFDQTGLPEPLILMLIGMLIGPMLGWVDGDQMAAAAPYFGTLALILILFEGGMSLEIDKILSGFAQATLLMTGSFLATVVLLGVVAKYAIPYASPGEHATWMTGALFGVIFAGAPSGVIAIPIINRMKVPDKVKTIVNLESSFSDVLCVVSAVAIMNMINVGDAGGAGSAPPYVVILQSFVLAAAVGIPAGTFWIYVLNRWLRRHSLSYVMTLGMLMLMFSFTGLIGGSGAIAVLCFGVALTNAPPFLLRMGWWPVDPDATWRFVRLEDNEEEKRLESTHAEISFLTRTFFFVYLGVVARIVVSGPFYVIMVIAFMGAIFLARFGSLRLFELVFPRQEEYRDVYLTLIPRGLAAAVLAGMPAARGIAGTASFVDYGFALILLTNIYTTVGVFLLKRRQAAAATAEPTAAS